MMERQPRRALVDIHMPDVDGLTVLKALLALEAPPAVAMLTGFGSDAAEILGIDGVIKNCW